MCRMRQVALYEALTAEEVWALIRELGARTLVFDVEPLVAVWATDTAALDSGVAYTLRRIGELGGGAGGGDAGAEAGAAAGAEHDPGVEAGADIEPAADVAAEAEVAEAEAAGALVAEAIAAEAESSGSSPAGGPEVVLFATNSDRLPTVLPSLAGVRVGYRASAAKPLRIKGYRDLPRPGVVIGDQIATDGALAWRLGFDFIFYRPERDRIPFRPRLLHLIGGRLRPVLFRPFR